jgi:hypothetical protein
LLAAAHRAGPIRSFHGVFVKVFCLLISVLALCACNAFDEDHLAALRSDFSYAPQADGGAQDSGDVIPPSDGSIGRDDDRDDESVMRLDGGGIVDDGNNAPDAPELTVCDDEDAGATFDADSDDDGAPDCVDLCPLDPEKDGPGLCGCGHPDAEAQSSPSCATLRSALVHRFRFDGTGTVVTDERGTAHGKLMNATLAGQGSLALAGGTSDQYVDLPNGILTSHTNITIEAWVTWNGGAGWQRIFDFGESDASEEGVNGVGKKYLMLSPLINDRSLGAAYASDGPDSAVFVESAESLVIGRMQHVALVFDDDNDQMKLYLNGKLVGGAVVTGALTAISDRNNWLGRSQWVGNESFAGSMHEVRIYDDALSPAQVELSFSYGTDPAFLSD